MNTQELKQYIDRVLGNKIRCLLPSFWWKRLFKLVLDKVDEKISVDDIKTINGESIVGEGDLRVGVKTIRVWVNEENTPEQIAENVATFSELKDGSPTNVVLAIEDELDKISLSVSQYEVGEDIVLTHYSQKLIDGSVVSIYINVFLSEDGSTEVEEEYVQP